MPDTVINAVQSHLFSDGKFLSLDEFQKKCDLEVNFLHYFQLLAAIPLDLKRKAFDSPTPDLFSASLEYHQLEDRTLILPKLRCKNYYKLFIISASSKYINRLRGRLHEPGWLGRRAGSVCRDDCPARYYLRRASPPAAKFRSCRVKRWLHRRA